VTKTGVALWPLLITHSFRIASAAFPNSSFYMDFSEKERREASWVAIFAIPALQPWFPQSAQPV
jgi:hypothetical protein